MRQYKEIGTLTAHDATCINSYTNKTTKINKLSKMKKQTLIASAMFGLTALVASAQISTNIGVTSNYVWRHMSYSGDGPAVSGGLDYAHDSGFYAGTWTSSMDDAGNTGSLDGQAEIDLYVGFGGDFSETTSYDVGIIRYDYTDATVIDAYFELYGSVTFSGLTVGAAYSFGSETDNTATGQEIFVDDDIYIYGSYTMDMAKYLGEGFSLTGTIGQYFFEDDGVGGVGIDYTHYTFDLAKDVGDFGTITLTGSFVSGDFGNVGFNGGDNEGRFFVSWGKEF